MTSWIDNIEDEDEDPLVGSIGNHSSDNICEECYEVLYMPKIIVQQNQDVQNDMFNDRWSKY